MKFTSWSRQCDTVHFHVGCHLLNSERRKEKENTQRELKLVNRFLLLHSRSPQAPMRSNHSVNTNLVCQFRQTCTATSIKEKHSKNMFN